MELFKKAQRAQTKLRLALTGPAGSGKTLSALRLARGLVGDGGKIALIDTENGSASYYAGRNGNEFDTAIMSPPYEVRKYTMAIKAAEDAGYDAVIVDSLSHAWAGEGGLLQKKEAMDARGGNSFVNWGKITPEQNALVNAVLHSKTNIICTMRTKTEYAIEENTKGKQAPKKLGLAPVQRDGFEYEFDVVLDIDVDTHTAKASKDRLGVFAGVDPFLVTEETGVAIRNWQNQPAEKKGKDKVEAHREGRLETIKNSMGWAPTDAQVARLYAIGAQMGFSRGAVDSELFKEFGVVSPKELVSTREYERAIEILENDNEEIAAGES